LNGVLDNVAGRVIIREMFLSEKQTLSKQALGGIAGGDKVW
jgi:hypothetical protein